MPFRIVLFLYTCNISFPYCMPLYSLSLSPSLLPSLSLSLSFPLSLSLSPSIPLSLSLSVSLSNTHSGIASHQHTYNQPNTVGALTLAATGTKVQRSHSFNAPATTSSRAQQQKGSAHSRLRSSPRPQSYYEADSTAALVIGQPLLSTLPVSIY